MNITSYAQNFEDVMLWRALCHIERGLYIDIGAQDPVIDSVSFAFHEHGWQGIHVEPTPHYASLLRLKRPGDKVIQAAVGSDSAVLQFFEIPNTGISTADAAIAAQHRARGFDVHETNVPCIPLSAVYQICAGQEIHWLKIDVEGFEQQVLSSWGTSTARPWIVVVESTLPLTQIDNHQNWESILVGYGYASVYFDGLNRYYVSEAHSELKSAFASPPNVFDGFVLNGTASAPFHQLIAARYQEKISELEKQLDAMVLIRSGQERTIKEYQAEREHELKNLQEQLDCLKQERAARETLLHEKNSQSRQDVERLLRQLLLREQEVAAQLLQAQQQAEREKTELAHRHAEHATALQQQYAEREQALKHKLQALQEQLDRLQQERAIRETLLHEQNSQSRQDVERLLRQLLQREQEVAAQLHQAQQQAEREKTELAHRHEEHATALQQQYAEREQALQQKLGALQEQLDRLQQERAVRETLLHDKNSQSREDVERLLRQVHSLEKDWARNEKALRHKLAVLQRDVQAFHRARRLLVQQHNTELSTKLDEHQRVLDACSALQTDLKAQILFEREASMQLRQSLVEVQHQLGMVHTALSWRLTAPLRRLAAFFRYQGNSATASLNAEDLTNSINKAAAAPQSSETEPASVESPVPNTLVRAHSIARDHATEPVTPLLETHETVSESPTINNIQDRSIEAFMSPTTPVTMPTKITPASTLDELLTHFDHKFVECAYQTLLGRTPDLEGFCYYLNRLRMGSSKMQILAQLLLSDEGKTHAVTLPGLNVALQRYRRGQWPLVGWLSRLLDSTEGNHYSHRKLRAIENQLFLLDDESNRRFSQIEMALARLQHLVVQQNQSVVAPTGSSTPIEPEGLIISSSQPSDVEGIKKLSPRARDIYFQLKTAAATHARRFS